MKTKTKNFVSIILNSLLVIFVLIGIIFSLKQDGLGMFKFYTQDSNYLALIVSIIFLISQILNRKTGKLPKFINLLRFIATSCLFVTFTVVIFILIPSFGLDSAPKMLFAGSSLYFHTLCPLLSIISFIFFENQLDYPTKAIIVPLIPTFIYACITLTLNVTNVLYGPYPFLHVHEQSVFMSFLWILIIFAIATLLAFSLYYLQKKFNKQK